jgi:hypothetical protein
VWLVLGFETQKSKTTLAYCGRLTQFAASGAGQATARVMGLADITSAKLIGEGRIGSFTQPIER